MTTSAAENLAGKKDEKVEKRRALGRGLESLLPGPRAVATEPRVVSADGSVSSGEKQIPHFVRNDKVDIRNDRVDVQNGSVDIRNDKVDIRNNKVGEDAPVTLEAPASELVEAMRAGVSGPYDSTAHESLRQQQDVPASSPVEHAARVEHAGRVEHAASGGFQARSHAAPREDFREVISIQAEAMPANLVIDLDIDLIDKNPYQTRYVFDEEALTDLKESIKEHGVVQPIVVRPAAEEGRYILVLGERRLRASKMAAIDTIPALVRRLSLQQAAEMTVLENVVREDLNPVEQAEAFRVLSKEFKLTQSQIAERIGVSRETVANYMRLLRLPKKVMEYMLADRLSFSDAREILRLENDEFIEQVAEEVVTHKLKWDQIEDRVMRINGSFAPLPGQTIPGAEKQRRGARWVDPNVRAAQLEMERTLGMRVRIRDRNGKGRIVIEYANVDDYERVMEMLRKK